LRREEVFCHNQQHETCKINGEREAMRREWSSELQEPLGKKNLVLKLPLPSYWYSWKAKDICASSSRQNRSKKFWLKVWCTPVVGTA
jgi:hypothetical protein